MASFSEKVQALFISAVDLDLQGCGLVRARVGLHYRAMNWTRQAYLNTSRDLLVRLGFKIVFERGCAYCEL